MGKMFKRNITSLKLVFALELLVVFLIVFGIMPRELALVLLGILVFYIVFSPLEDSLILFIASIPIFVALPITEGFDSLSSARVIILLLFLKWLYGKRKSIWPGLKSLTIKKIFKEYKLEFLTIVLFVVVSLSIMYAVDVVSAVKKVIYLINLVILFPIVKDFVKNRNLLKRINKAVLISFTLVFLIALGQLISVYFFTVGGFWDWWADHFSVGFYGENLKQIVKNTNAWFAYSPIGPSVVRLFGSFTDPHSFALYLLLTLPFLIAFALPSLRGKTTWKEGLIILVLFFIILSGTRGVWLGVIFGIMACIYLLILKLNTARCVSLLLLILFLFIALIPISSVFTVIPQFKEQDLKDIDAVLLLKRLSSILDLKETSNQGRTYIWLQSINSLKENFWLGIGIGNFPAALNQNIDLAKAGSSAHNLYLNFAVESGIFALILIILIIIEIVFAILSVLKSNFSSKSRLLFAGFFVFLIWIFGYSLFDIALLDERVFLLFLTIVGIIYGVKTGLNNSINV